jgi:hypothetical protein
MKNRQSISWGPKIRMAMALNAYFVGGRGDASRRSVFVSRISKVREGFWDDFQAAWGWRPARNSFSRLCVAQISFHSA